uniref:Uncharacterized protein n=1 Tax=Haptolina brevifila TaxID=156173 RepID=A0A6U7MXV1_9EUKA|mmetsp:Transcript_81364/g.161801  ORF Transcript_81364/g.161801 Transcript_81364/m.161801 type:complete len:160 (+) Transcript_81364:592-1071(+)
MCSVNTSSHFTCCGWPWLVPELRNLIVRVLRTAGTLRISEVWGELKREQRLVKANDPKGCVRDCLSLTIPGPNSLVGILKELEHRGDLRIGSEPSTSPQLDSSQPASPQPASLETASRQSWPPKLKGKGKRAGGRRGGRRTAKKKQKQPATWDLPVTAL